MEQITHNLKNLKIAPGFTKERALANEIWLAWKPRFKEMKVEYMGLLGIIENRGKNFCYEAFNDVRHSKVDNPLALFFYLVGKQKIEWEES